MTDPYIVLGVARTASDDEVKTAYRNLAKKYHPDNYASAPDIADVAADKMREVNEAYDTIVKERKNGGSGGSYSSSSSGSKPSSSYQSSSSYSNTNTNAGSSSSSYSGSTGYQAPTYGAQQNAGTYQNTYSTTTSFADVRRLIMDNRFDDANAVLEGVPTDRRNAEWNFLKGTVLYHRGWLEQAYVYLNTAVNMEPGNSEFRAAFNQASNMRSGSSGGYKVGKNSGGGCGNPCNMCCSLLCADQCCECFGGDLISCC